MPTPSRVRVVTSSWRARRRVQIGRISIDALRFDEAIDAIDDLVSAGEGGMVFTPNVDHVVMAEEDVRLREAYASADLSLVDGVPVLWAARALGSPLPEKLSGSDLIEPLVARGAERGWRIYLLGGRDGVAARAKQIFEREYPGVRIVGVSSPMVDLSDSLAEQESILASIRQARPDLLFLALGAPKQEIWGHRIREAVKPAVILGIGASLDFVAGTASRAPEWVSSVGLEWLYRLAQEPRRLWKRYLVRDPKFVAIVARQAWRPTA
ncbi:MAG TPA: WecB/TagA/CpsF family glycosyltransferase [Polyangiaceae bacterium]|jgi:N-acetylglucosaminyldiphosphoundecaprenol N-acetyl-beta-D-mannosaminyltransferase|nr:WecB/TagA/CpsF family glycosyltransferase [Polyangiaceae bacterium]